MTTGKTIVAQVMEHPPLPAFRKCVQLYGGNYKVKSFSGLDQFLVMALAQLSYRESLRDIEACLWADFAQVLIHTARHLCHESRLSHLQAPLFVPSSVGFLCD